MRFNAITICHVRELELGDLIAHHVVGSYMVTGVVTGIVHYPFQLTPEQREYMIKMSLDIPQKDTEPIAGSGSVLLFGDFNGSLNHAYLNLDINVAVFHSSLPI